MSGELVSWNEFPVLLALFGFLALPKSSLILPLRPGFQLRPPGRTIMPRLLEEKVVVISGGATGIALATANKFVSRLSARSFPNGNPVSVLTGVDAEFLHA
jgi:hypothetical protein